MVNPLRCWNKKLHFHLVNGRREPHLHRSGLDCKERFEIVNTAVLNNFLAERAALPLVIFFALKKSLRPIVAAAEPSRSDGTAESGAFFSAFSAVFEHWLLEKMSVLKKNLCCKLIIFFLFLRLVNCVFLFSLTKKIIKIVLL